MGCLNSKEAGTVRGGGRDEGQVNLIFQAKHQRANVFTSGVNIDDGFKPANIPKGEKQKELIRKYLLKISKYFTNMTLLLFSFF